MGYRTLLKLGPERIDYSAFKVEPCDIFFTRGYGFFSELIRIDESTWDDSKAVINHVGMVVNKGSLFTADAVEALAHVEKHTIYSQYHDHKDKIAIFRPIGLSLDDSQKIIQKGLSYVGEDYGYLKIFGHFLDYFTGGHYIFRRVFNNDNYPICSWVVAHAYKAADLNFGCDPGMANPDDIWDYCIKHPLQYTKVFDLTKI